MACEHGAATCTAVGASLLADDGVHLGYRVVWHCPACDRWHTPKADADGVVGQGRLGIRLLSLLAYLRTFP